MPSSIFPMLNQSMQSEPEGKRRHIVMSEMRFLNIKNAIFTHFAMIERLDLEYLPELLE
jgi:hypothetical protein